MKGSKRFWEFNKEILSGEVGAIIGAALGGFIYFLIAHDRKTTPVFTVLGAIIGASLFFVSTKVYHRKRSGELCVKKIAKELALYSSATFFICLFIGYPLLYFLTGYLLDIGFHSLTAGAIAELCVFLVFLLLINIYRLILLNKFHKEI